jgi:hypothetical protein
MKTTQSSQQGQKSFKARMGRNQSKPEWAIDQSSTFEFLKSKPAISPNNFFCATL